MKKRWRMNLNIFSDFEFHVNFEPHRWYPFMDGILQEKDPRGIAEFPFGRAMYWNEFPQDTRVGEQSRVCYE
jgi:hypothetical protein